jgi:glycosyltransferase involved in cell wall biosynthesis
MAPSLWSHSNLSAYSEKQQTAKSEWQIAISSFYICALSIMSLEPDIDLILPAYNPVMGWDEAVRERLGELRKRLNGIRVRAILVNDGSAYNIAGDSMAKIESTIDDLLLVSYPHNMGKGFAIRAGVQRSLAPVIVYTDIDFPYTFESMLKIIGPVLRKEADATIAVRNETYYGQLPMIRRWMSKLLRYINSRVLRLHTSDTQGGLKAFSGDLRDLFLQTRINRYLFDLEFLHLLSRQKGLRVMTVESDLRPGIVMSRVRLGIMIREAWNFLRILLSS